MSCSPESSILPRGPYLGADNLATDQLLVLAAVQHDEGDLITHTQRHLPLHAGRMEEDVPHCLPFPEVDEPKLPLDAGHHPRQALCLDLCGVPACAR